MEDGQIKYVFSNASEAMPLAELCEAATMRWPIEQCYQDVKSKVGMDKVQASFLAFVAPPYTLCVLSASVPSSAAASF